MKRAQRTDLLREMKKSFNRYISILLIMALGVAFYAGVRSAEPDMQLTAKEFYDTTNYMDIRVLGTLGMTEQDVSAIGAVEDVELVEGGYQTELFLDTTERDYQMTVYSMGDAINQVYLEEGRLPQKQDECFVDQDFMESAGYSIGDVIVLKADEGTELSDVLAVDTFTIVGSGSFPSYLSWQRGAVSIGTGVEDGFLFLPKEAFSMEVFTVVYATVEGAKEYNPYTEEYDDYVTEVVERIEAIADARCEIRYAEVTDPYWEDIYEAEADIADGERELADGEQELKDAEQELADAEQEIADAEKEIADGEKEIADGELELADAKAEIEDGERQLADAEKELADAKAEIEDGERQLAEAEQELADAKAEIEDGERQLADGEKELADGEVELADAEKELVAGEAELKEAEEKLLSGEAELKKAEEEITAGEAELKEAEEKLLSGEAELKKAEKEITLGEAELAAAEEELKKGEAELLTAEKEILANETLLTESEKELTAAKEQLETGRAELEAGKKVLVAKEEELAAVKAQLEVYGMPLTPELLVAEEELKAAKEQMAGKEAELAAGEQQIKISETEFVAGKEQLAVAKEQLALAKAEIAAGWEETKLGKKTLEVGRTELEKAKKELEMGRAEYEAGKKTLEEGRAELVEAAKELAEGRAEYEEGKQELADGRVELEKARTELENGRKEIETAKAELLDGRTKYEEGLAEYKQAKAELEDGRKQYEDGLAEYEQAKLDLEDGRKQYEEGLAEIKQAKLDLEKGKKELADAKQEIEDAKVEIADAKIEIEDGKKELSDGKQELADAKKELEDIEQPEWYVLDRNTIQQFVEYGMNSERIGNLGDVFPAVFYLVAALVSLTTMTRMIEEERTQIGTMKALGYGKGAIVSKYMWYSLSATLLGGVLGVVLGSFLFPWVIITAYGILYSNLPYLVMPVQWDLSIASVMIAVICTVVATLSSCYKELMAAPAILMRPVAPAAGKRVLLEYVKPVWNHMSFSWKATCRNLFRYKKRFFMTIFGIGGCMALLLVGFGLRDSIMEIVNNQYKHIWTYDAYISVNDTELGLEGMAAEKLMENRLFAQVKNLDAETEAAVKSASLFVPERLEDLEEFLKLKDRVTQEKYTLTEQGVIVSEKLAKTLEVSVGDAFEIYVDDVTKRPVTVTAVAENYMSNYIYMSAAQYEEVFEEAPEFNQLYLKLPEMTLAEEEEFSRELLNVDAVDAVTYVHELQESVATMMQALELVVVVLIVAAGMLAFIVLYNLNNINIIERRRELATLKVLGFYDMEVGSYVYRENVLLTVLGILAGVVMGFFLHRFVILTVEVDMIMFGRNIELPSYVYSVLLTCVFAVLINLGMFFKLKKIDMVESLKSAE